MWSIAINEKMSKCRCEHIHTGGKRMVAIISKQHSKRRKTVKCFSKRTARGEFVLARTKIKYVRVRGEQISLRASYRGAATALPSSRMTYFRTGDGGALPRFRFPRGKLPVWPDESVFGSSGRGEDSSNAASSLFGTWGLEREALRGEGLCSKMPNCFDGEPGADPPSVGASGSANSARYVSSIKYSSSLENETTGSSSLSMLSLVCLSCLNCEKQNDPSQQNWFALAHKKGANDFCLRALFGVSPNLEKARTTGKEET